MNGLMPRAVDVSLCFICSSFKNISSHSKILSAFVNVNNPYTWYGNIFLIDFGGTYRFFKTKWIKFFSCSTYNGCILSLITFMSFCLLLRQKHCICLLINKRSKCQYARKKIKTGKILSAFVHTFFFFQ